MTGAQLYGINNKKMSCCAYRVTLGRINTIDKLENCAKEFVMHNDQPESIHHIFFNCNYIKYIWTIMKLKLNMYACNNSLNIEDEVHLLKTCFWDGDQINQLTGCCIVTTYHMWDECNKRIFQHKSLNKIERAKLIQLHIT